LAIGKLFDLAGRCQFISTHPGILTPSLKSNKRGLAAANLKRREAADEES
jgi:hypothetical protein